MMVGARRQEQGHPLLRPLLPRLGDPRDRRPAAPGLPDALVLATACSSASGQIGRPCLLGYIGKCSAPCVGRSPPRSTARSSTTSATSWPARRQRVRQAHRAARCTPPPTAQEYERAARLRDDLGALERALEKQAVVLGDGTDADVIALAEDPLEVAVQIFYVRGGRIRGQRGWVADRVDDGGTARAGRGLPAPALRRRGGRRRSRARSWCRRCRRTPTTFEQLLERPARQPGSRSGCRSAATSGRCMETVARNAGAGAGHCTRPSGPAT